jgi:hemoglobin-like flavoprotein
MTEADQAQIRRTFALLEPQAEVTALVFYRRLFTLQPSLRRLFLGDIRTQSQKLMQMLRVIVESLDAPDVLVAMLEAMGARHAGYGVEDAHYDMVGEALLGAFAEGLGDEFTAEAREAWTKAYGFIAETMQRGAMKATVAT